MEQLAKKLCEDDNFQHFLDLIAHSDDNNSSGSCTSHPDPDPPIGECASCQVGIA